MELAPVSAVLARSIGEDTSMTRSSVRPYARELLSEAAEARALAATFKDRSAIADLIAYASTLEAEIRYRDESTRRDNCRLNALPRRHMALRRSGM
jgi:hypothetical protein